MRYLDLYYATPTGGIDFNDSGEPDYRDFAYLALTIGMTYQVSDTNLTTRAVRRTATRHALLAFLFGSVIVALLINSPWLQPNRRSIAVTTGERTATPKSDTKITRRTFAIDASAQATAAMPATTRIVQRESETLTSRPPVSRVPEAGSATVICSAGGRAPVEAPQSSLSGSQNFA